MAEDQPDRYRILGIHAYAPHGQLDRHAQRDLNKLAAEGWRVVAATGWALILEHEASPARAEAVAQQGSALAELLSRRRSCERIAEALVRWSRAG
jgi:hypothetical protein